MKTYKKKYNNKKQKTKKNKSLHYKLNITEKRRIYKLPGLKSNLSSKTYISYIKLPNTEKHIHYWFIEAEKNPKKAPLFFWTNGGPGCSGLMGLFEEVGPYKVDKKLNLIKNPYSWTKFANVVFIEQPVGVGFSFSPYKKDYISNDKLSAKDNLSFTLEFLNIYNDFKKNDIYITTESYGGHYAPLWAKEIVDYNNQNKNNQINLKGFIIANPYINYITGNESSVETYWGHQKIPHHLWEKFKKHNCTKSTKQYRENKCNNIFYQIEDKIGKMNPYAIDYPICLSHQQTKLINIINNNNHIKKEVYNPCEDTYTKEYLNTQKMKNIIHPYKTNIKWKQCSDSIKYNFKDTYKNMEKVIKKLLHNNSIKDLNILILSGTNDSICGTVGTQKWINKLDLKKIIDWEQYYINNEPQGYISSFQGDGTKSLTLASVNFAGHEVPMYKPISLRLRDIHTFLFLPVL